MTDLPATLTVEQVFALYERPPWNHNMVKKSFSELAVGTVFKDNCMGYGDPREQVIIKKGRKFAYFRYADNHDPRAAWFSELLDYKVWVSCSD